MTYNNDQLTSLNTYLSDKSYIVGYHASSVDEEVFGKVDAKLIIIHIDNDIKKPLVYPYVSRWYNHIKSLKGDGSQKFEPHKFSKESEESTKYEKFVEELKQKAAGPSASSAPAKKEKDEDDLFGDDDEDDEEYERQLQARKKAAEDAKGKKEKEKPIAKSSVVLDVKGWGDETDMGEVEKLVRAIEMDGLVWGASKLVDLAYGIKKLQISCVVVDDLVSVEELQERIQNGDPDNEDAKNADLIQSTDIQAFNKI